jgi:hypothetical protein
MAASYKKPEDGTWVPTVISVFAAQRRNDESGVTRITEDGRERGTTSDGWRLVNEAFVRVGGVWRKFYEQE